MCKLPEDNFVLLETNRFDRDNYKSYLFSGLAEIISCYKLEDVKGSFLRLEDFLSKGFYAAGFISYEAGFSFEDRLKGLYKKTDFPLMWFGIYKKPLIFTHREKVDFLLRRKVPYSVTNLKANISKQEYVQSIEKIKDFIRQGNTYQVNYTFKYKFNFSGSPLDFYKDLKEKQSVSYSAFINTAEFSILSLSPELFFRKNKNYVEVRPMKGTIDRGVNLEKDIKNMKLLAQCGKNRSENVMIVDLLRNDLGRISESGSVKTLKLFEVERYETLLQMVSVVKSRLKKNIALYDLFKAIFPSGSVTGAPKISTMDIINSLEKEPRYAYTGSIGFLSPKKEAIFNVAIRTVLIDNKKKTGEMGVGSGIVYDSDPYAEFEECRLKANFITQKKSDFKLIETLLWRPLKGYFLLKYHLERIKASAVYFDFRLDKKEITKSLKNLEKKLSIKSFYKIRLLLDKKGNIELTFSKIDNSEVKVRTGFSDKKTHSSDVFLYHKTTNRSLYDNEHAKWRKKGYFDVIFTNEKNQVTEGAISNIIIRKGRVYYTPPIECGLLNGIYRRSLLIKKKFPLKEKVLYRRDLYNADKIYMVNSVRGMMEVELE